MNRFATIISLTLFLSAFLSLQAQTERQKINFDEDWKFHLGNASDPAKDFNFKIANIFSKAGKAEGTAINPRFDDRSWQTIQLPHDWAVGLPFQFVNNEDLMSHGYKAVGALFPENSIGWYRKKFNLAKTDSRQHFSIQFDGIYRDAIVWINGFYLGNNHSGYVGAEYDITDYLNYGKENVIVVRVDATQSEGWFYEGAGIYRHVWLNRYNPLHIPENGLFIYSKVGQKDATVFIETTIDNQTLAKSKCSVLSIITDRSGRKIAETKDLPVSFLLNEKKIVKQQFIVTNPHLWSLEDPYLYRVTSLVKQDGKIIDQITNRFGIRTISIDMQNGVTLNGKHIKIQGVNCHQDHAGVGLALPDYLQYYRVKLLKELGINAYRTSHHPATPELLDACDSLGMLVLSENRLLNSSPQYMHDFEQLILRDRSRTSVFLWSVGNEEGYVQHNNIGKNITRTLMAKLQELDPTRVCTYAADMGNEFTGINEIIPVRGFNYREKSLVPYHSDHPAQPVIGTEMGSTVTTRGIYEKDTVRCYVPDQDITAPWWASTAEAWWPIAADNNWMLGGFVWTGFDYRGEPTPYQWPNISSHFGIMDVCGFPKNIYYYYQSWWTDKDVLHISPHWNWNGKEGLPIEVWVNSNADNVELFLNGKSLGKKEMLRNSHLKWVVPYEAGKLEAIAFKKGRKITTSIETTGVAVKLVAVADKSTLLADGRDATVINIYAVDAYGREVSVAQDLIKAHAEGNVHFVGVGNGDPSSHEADICTDGNWQRSLFNGKCQFILQSGKESGNAIVHFTADGLTGNDLTINITKL